jgi:hypothetical protein
MADEPTYVARTLNRARVFRSLAGYLQSIAHYGPPLTSKSLPSKVESSKAAQKQAEAKKSEEKKEEKKDKKPLTIETWLEVDYAFVAVESSVEVEYKPEFLDIESSGAEEKGPTLDWSTETGESLVLDWDTSTDESLVLDWDTSTESKDRTGTGKPPESRRSE